MTPREALLDVVDRNDGVALALARAIKQLEGWRGSDTSALNRIRQCLRGVAGRHFDIDWAVLAAGICVRFDVQEPVTPLIDEARRDAEYELRRERRDVPIRFVRPGDRIGHRRVG